MGWLAVLTIFPCSLADPSAQCRDKVWVIRLLSDAQGYRIFVFVQVRPADVLFNPEPGGDQGALFTHNVARDCVVIYSGVCFVLYLICVLA